MKAQLICVLRELKDSVFRQDRRTEKRKTGDRSEAFAANYLKHSEGFQIIARNWTLRHHELDIVARDCDILVFIEVRSRKEGAKVSGFHSITKKKRESLKSACRAYLNSLPKRAPHFRFDIIEIEHSSSGAERLRHFRSVPLF